MTAPHHLTTSFRITCRFEVGELSSTPPKSVDVTVPASSSLEEALPELTELAGAPMISVPWLARTVAGTPVDMSVPLPHAGVTHGDVLVFSPWEDIDPPLRTDAAEALTDLDLSFSAHGLAASTALLGLVSLGFLSLTAALPTVTNSALLLLLLVLAGCVAAWLRTAAPEENLSAGMFALALPLASGTTVWTLVAGSMGPSDPAHVGWLAIASVVAALVTALFLWWVTRPGLSLVVLLFTAAAIVVVASGVLIVSGSTLSAAAVAVAVCFAVLLASPQLATVVAGLKVPALPAAGQDLRVADQAVDKPVERAWRATRVLDGVCLGAGAVAALALLYLGWRTPSPGFVCGFALASSIAVALHATRHRSTPAMWGLWLWFLAGLGAVVFSGPAAGPGGAIVAVVAMMLGLTAPLWAHRIRGLSPTVFNWLERGETLALAAVFPLAAHLAGLFDAIRGLG
ncbi:type VII secretion integral membrane protein EccD [Corynebacterium hindlerae]|uniref:Type VII secretion integral membrane protein EccD n=1 Tax=Corynebacterium hindlerae TaxID=699041 RepID=A0A7G5FHK5_9CORY|nr:type VII secretion integral membrane protein EccD [Corynebacterium hindlerae]QMV86096.1 type VII secretion integral membrane protein EccD [Corynebacterium hindlerae]